MRWASELYLKEQFAFSWIEKQNIFFFFLFINIFVKGITITLCSNEIDYHCIGLNIMWIAVTPGFLIHFLSSSIRVNISEIIYN